MKRKILALTLAILLWARPSLGDGVFLGAPIAAMGTGDGEGGGISVSIAWDGGNTENITYTWDTENHHWKVNPAHMTLVITNNSAGHSVSGTATSSTPSNTEAESYGVSSSNIGLSLTQNGTPETSVSFTGLAPEDSKNIFFVFRPEENTTVTPERMESMSVGGINVQSTITIDLRVDNGGNQ